jgi:hypothetical protein
LKALTNAGINDILRLLILDKQQIDALKYDDNGTMIWLAPGHKNMVTIFIAYVCHRIIICDPIMDDYVSVTSDEFEAYNGNDYLMFMNDAPTKSNAVATFLEDSKQHLDTFSITKAIQHSNDTASNRRNPRQILLQWRLCTPTVATQVQSSDILGHIPSAFPACYSGPKRHHWTGDPPVNPKPWANRWDNFKHGIEPREQVNRPPQK